MTTNYKETLLSLRQFKKLSGRVFAPVSLTGDMSDYVQVTKSDLIASLRRYGITHVEVLVQPNGDVLYYGAADAEGRVL